MCSNWQCQLDSLGSIIFVSISLTMPCRNTDAACSISVLRCTRLLFLGGFPLDSDTGSLSEFSRSLCHLWTANMGQSWLMELHGGRMQTEELFCGTDNPLLCLLHKSDVAALRCWLPFPWGSSEPVCEQYPSLMQGAGHRTAQAPGLCMQLGGCFLQLFEESVFSLSANSVCVCFPSNSMNRYH